MKQYSKDFDDGWTLDFRGRRLKKDDAVMEAYGTIDELSSFIGLARASITDLRINDVLKRIQEDLFIIGSDIGYTIHGKGGISHETVLQLSVDHVKQMEGFILEFEGKLPQLKNFILPSGSAAAALLQTCRAVCRRAERYVVTLKNEQMVNLEVLRYLNRLSDLLFSMARVVNHQDRGREDVWSRESLTRSLKKEEDAPDKKAAGE